MSAETKIQYPFPKCKDCPAAKMIVEAKLQTSPISKSGKTEAIQLTCWVKTDEEKCYIGGTIINTYASNFWGKQRTEVVTNHIGVAVNHAPNFCPQLKNEES